MNLAIDTFPKERFGLITGSKCTVMFPLKGDGKKGMITYAKQLANQKYFQFYDERTGWQTEHGKMAEVFAFMHYEETYGKLSQGQFYKEGECGGSTDAESEDSVIDFKCPVTLEAWLDYLYFDIDEGQKDQLNMYMYLAKKSSAKIAAYLIETQFMSDNGLTYPVPQDKRMIVINVPKDPTWSDRLIEPRDFVISQRNEFLEKLKNKFG
jgi:hypothetical protein